MEQEAIQAVLDFVLVKFIVRNKSDFLAVLATVNTPVQPVHNRSKKFVCCLFNTGVRGGGDDLQ